MNWKKATVPLALLVVALAASAQSPDFSRIVVLGDSLSAGFYDGSLNERGQEHSYAVLFAQQAESTLALPLISYPGIPIALELQGFDPATGFPILVLAGEEEGELMDPTSQPTNLAVPGQTSLDCLSKVPDEMPDSMTDLVLGFPRVYLLQEAPLSQVGLAEVLQPTFVILWIGSNDVLGGALAGDTSLTIPNSVFEPTYASILEALSATGARMVLANLPDVTVVAALTKGAALKSMGLDLKLLGIKKNDYVTPEGLERLPAILAGLDPGPLGPGDVLTQKEAKAIQKIVKADNKSIEKLAKQHNVPVVDVYGELNKIAKNGYTLPGGQLLTTAFLGGIFSLDGVHPTYAGQAIVANFFIEAVNKHYGTQLSPVEIPTAEALAEPAEGFVNGGLNLPVVPGVSLAPITAAVAAEGR